MVLTFDKNGKYIRRYSHLGQGSGEYISLKDFEISGDSLFLLDSQGRQLLVYRLNDDSFVTSDKIEKARGVHVIKEQLYALNKGLGYADFDKNKSYESYSVVEKGKTVYRDKSYNPHLCGRDFSLGEGSNCFYHYEDTTWTHFYFNDTLYTVRPSDGRLAPYWVVQIDDEQIGLTDDRQTVDKLRNTLSKGGLRFL